MEYLKQTAKEHGLEYSQVELLYKKYTSMGMFYEKLNQLIFEQKKVVSNMCSTPKNMIKNSNNMTQQELSELTGIAQPQISRYLKQIKAGDLFRKPILKILEVQGKGEIVREFVKEINK